MNREEEQALRNQIAKLQDRIDALEKNLNKYTKKTDGTLKTLEKQLIGRIETVYRKLRTTQVVEKQKLTFLEQTISRFKK